MTAPTHIAFSLLCSTIGNTNYLASAACVLGSLLPDLDHPRSSIGRVFFFISHPLNMRFGHRGLVHSFFLWGSLLLLSILLKFEAIKWLAIGALSHVLIDCYNTSGVRAFWPFNEKSVVMFKRDWRVNTGSLGEIYVFILIAALLPAAHFSQVIGGPRKLINLMIQSHKITLEEYQRAGTRRCYVAGRFRWNDGRTEDVNWLIVGTEGQNLIYFDGEKLIREDKHGHFLKSKLTQTSAEWISVKLNGIGIVKHDSFFYDGKKWYHVRGGSKVMGVIRSINNAMPEIQIERQASPTLSLDLEI